MACRAEGAVRDARPVVLPHEIEGERRGFIEVLTCAGEHVTRELAAEERGACLAG